MKKIKKVLAAILSMSLCALPAVYQMGSDSSLIAQAAVDEDLFDEIVEVNNVKYGLDFERRNATVLGLVNRDELYVFIEENVKSHSGEIFPVERIGPCAFNGCTLEDIDFAPEPCNLEEIYIPSSVDVIGYMAFAFCNNLKKIVFKEGAVLRLVGVKAFYNCKNLEEFLISYRRVTNTISRDAFDGTRFKKKFPIADESIYIGSLFSTQSDSDDTERSEIERRIATILERNFSEPTYCYSEPSTYYCLDETIPFADTQSDVKLINAFKESEPRLQTFNIADFALPEELRTELELPVLEKIDYETVAMIADTDKKESCCCAGCLLL